MNDTVSLFGRMRLGYLLVESARIDAWQRFVAEGLGAHVDRLHDDALAVRIDAHARRLVVQRGPREDVTAIGWHLDDEAALQLASERLLRLGVTVREIADERAALRGVGRYHAFTGPKQLTHELFLQPQLAAEPLRMHASGFLTGAGGMGHVAVSTRCPEQMHAFWQQVFDARLSDRIEDRLDGIELDLAFLRFNERHHTLATAATRGLRMNPFRTQIHHLNFEAASLDDVTEAYRRCRTLGYAMANGIGQHPNDREVSFYVVSPSGFEIELGWKPLRVDESSWMPAVHQGISLWGHGPENLSARLRLGRGLRALRSLTQREYTAGDAS